MSQLYVLLAIALGLVSILAGVATFILLKKKKKPSGGAGGGGGGGGTAVSNGKSGETVISFYGQSSADDNGEGATGVDLFKMKGITFQGKPVYPVAVHHDDAPAFLYKILQIQGKGVKPIQGIVLDYCDRKDAPCVNKKKFNKNFLVDIHALGFAAAGMSDGLTTGTYKVIGEMRPSQLPKSGWLAKVAAGKDYMLCSCSGQCTGKEQKWTLLKDCR